MGQLHAPDNKTSTFLYGNSLWLRHISRLCDARNWEETARAATACVL